MSEHYNANVTAVKKIYREMLEVTEDNRQAAATLAAAVMLSCDLDYLRDAVERLVSS